MDPVAFQLTSLAVTGVGVIVLAVLIYIVWGDQ